MNDIQYGIGEKRKVIFTLVNPRFLLSPRAYAKILSVGLMK
jgi:hypothetical protein